MREKGRTSVLGPQPQHFKHMLAIQHSHIIHEADIGKSDLCVAF